MKPQFVSVIVPAYNEEKLLSNCLKSLKNQDYHHKYEIIVVDNNSSDNTVEIAKSFDVKVIKETQQGPIYAKQAGLIAAKGDVIAFIDADCVAPKNWLSILTKAFDIPNTVAVTGPYKIYDGPKYHQVIGEMLQTFTSGSYKLLKKNVYLAGGNFAMLKITANEFGGFDTTKNAGEDEYGILHKLKSHGDILFSDDLKILTSGRRAKKGFFSYVYEMVFKYWVNYITSLIFGKTFFPPYGSIR